MSHIVWDPQYSVNIEVIDEQHKHLFEVLGKLSDEMGKTRTKEVLGAIIGELTKYAVEHFATEEIFMTQYDYPGYAKHKEEHEAFKVKVAAFQKDFNSGKVSLSIEVINFIRGWLDHHILGTDQKYGPFLNEKGIF